jgi:hypothetical protein
MTAPVRYVVRRQEYTPPVAGVRRVLPEKWAAVATFAKRADADTEHAKQLAHFRRTHNPFQLGGPNLFYQTSLPPYALHDYLLDHDITPPPSATTSNPNYVFWWMKESRTFSDDQRAMVWRACDKLTPFEVIEEDDRQAAWLVVENEWLEQQNGSFIDEGRTYRVQVAERFAIREARRTLRKAEQVKGQLAAELRCYDSEDDGLLYFDTEGQSHEWVHAPLFGLRKVPAVGDLSASRACVVCRRRGTEELGSLNRGPVWEQLGYCDELHPLFATCDADAVGGWAAERTRIARRTVNPFAFVGAELFRPPLSTHAVTDNGSDELPNGLTLEDALSAVRRLDTTPPPPQSDELLADWYDQVVRWSPEFIDVIWGTFADFRLFEVVEVPFG